MYLPLDLSSFNFLRVDFDYYAVSFEEGEDFFLEISTDGGLNYEVIENWVQGGTPDIIENVVQNVSINYSGVFTENSMLRFRCDASSNADDVYIDNVRIYGSCSEFSGSQTGALVDGGTKNGTLEENESSEELMSDIRIVPNPVRTGQQITIYLEVSREISGTVRIFNNSGQILSEYTHQMDIGRNELEVGVERLPSGVYFVEVSNEQERLIKRLVIQ